MKSLKTVAQVSMILYWIIICYTVVHDFDLVIFFIFLVFGGLSLPATIEIFKKGERGGGSRVGFYVIYAIMLFTIAFNWDILVWTGAVLLTAPTIPALIYFRKQKIKVK